MKLRYLPNDLRNRLLLWGLLPLFAGLWLVLAQTDVSLATGPTEPDPDAEERNVIYLPLIQGEGTTAPRPDTAPFATMLDQARQQCVTITVNQACLGNGSAAGFQQAGDTITLTDGMTMTVRSNSPAVADWTVVVMRIQAASNEEISQTVTLSQSIDLVAVGNVDLKALHLITNTTVVSTMPSVHFENQVLVQDSERAPSGLLVMNTADESLLTLAVNGAGLTLGSTAFIEAAAGHEMTVKLREGSALIHAADAASAVVAGSEVRVALNAQGIVDGAPSEAELSSDELIVPLVINPPHTYHDELAAKLFRSLLQCHQANNPKRVYHTYYYIHQLRTPAMRDVGGEATVQTYAELVKQCARFEVIFDSTINGNNTVTWVDRVHSDGAFIQFDVNGNLVAPAASPLRHIQLEMRVPKCALQFITSADGEFAVEEASLRLHYNTMNITMETFPYMTEEQIPIGHFVCAGLAQVDIPIEWNTMFILLHPELWLPQPIYRLQETHWKYTGRQIFAEAIFAERSAPFGEGQINSHSYFILRHAPTAQ